jgi:hypothetical protein
MFYSSSAPSARRPIIAHDDGRHPAAAVGTVSDPVSGTGRGASLVSGDAPMPYGRIVERNSPGRHSVEIYGGLVDGTGPGGNSRSPADDDHLRSVAGTSASSSLHQSSQPRELHVMTSETSTIEVLVYDVPGRDNYLLTFTGK